MQARAHSANHTSCQGKQLNTGQQNAWRVALVNARQVSHRLAAQPQSRDVPSAQTLQRCPQPGVVRHPAACAASSRTDDPDADTADQSQVRCSPAVGLMTATLVAALLTFGDVADAAGLLVREEPANALSLPTWAIHVSSVIEWIVAMGLVWRYAEVTGRPAWKGLTWGMVPLLGGAFSACVYHFFYNSPQLDALVALQAALTFIGNGTCAWAAFRIYTASQDDGRARE